MKKQKFSLILTFTLILFTYLVGGSTKVNAGSAGVTGTSEDSTSSSGDNFNPGSSEPFVEPAPGVEVEFSSDGSINVATEVQNNLNETVINILNQNPDANSPAAIILVILLGGVNAEAAANQLQTYIVSLGVSSPSVASLVNALLALARNKSASVLGAPVGQLQPVQQVASTKGLMADLVIVQKGETPNVDIKKLNDAITAYNKIVMESSPKVIQKLAKDPQFLEVGKLLKQLRAALNKS